MAVAKHHVEVLAHVGALLLDPPVPPLGEIFFVDVLWLATVRASVAEGGKRRENVEGVADAADDFVAVQKAMVNPVAFCGPDDQAGRPRPVRFP